MSRVSVEKHFESSQTRDARPRSLHRPAGRRVSFKSAAAKVKPSRTRRPYGLAQLFRMLDADLFPQEMASGAPSNLGLHGSVTVDHVSRP